MTADGHEGRNPNPHTAKYDGLPRIDEKMFRFIL